MVRGLVLGVQGLGCGLSFDIDRDPLSPFAVSLLEPKAGAPRFASKHRVMRFSGMHRLKILE